MKIIRRLKHQLGPLIVGLLRALERCSPVWLFYGLLHPYGWFRAWRNSWRFVQKLPFQTLPSGPPTPAWDLTRFELTRALEFIPDRLASARWRDRCRIHGLDHLLEARRRGPVVLGFSHVGPITLAGFWLRAHGVPVTTLRFGEARPLSRARQYKNRYLLFPDTPAFLYSDQLREMVRALAGGGVVMVALDNGSGRQVDVPINEQWTFRMATGAMRLAARHQAELIPCQILSKGWWRFQIELGQPVPREFLRGEGDLPAIGKHLLAEARPHWQAHPNQCFPHLAACCHPVPPPHHETCAPCQPA